MLYRQNWLVWNSVKENWLSEVTKQRDKYATKLQIAKWSKTVILRITNEPIPGNGKTTRQIDVTTRRFDGTTRRFDGTTRPNDWTSGMII